MFSGRVRLGSISDGPWEREEELACLEELLKRACSETSFAQGATPFRCSREAAGIPAGVKGDGESSPARPGHLIH